MARLEASRAKRFVGALRELLSGLAVLVLAGCASGGPPPVLAPLQQLETRRPVVVLPGITGSELRDRATSRVVWGDFRSLWLPRDGGYAVALGLRQDTGSVEATAPVLAIDAGPFRIAFYEQILELLEANGFRRGDLAAPDRDANAYVFWYDWRRGSDLAAAALAERLEALRLARGEEVLEVDLICQSNSARVARYFLKYGGAGLERAESGLAAPPRRVRVSRLILAGTANGGGIGVLADLLEGRRFVPFLGRRFLPEVLFTFPAVFEELPVYLRRPFVGAEGRPLDVDLFDAAAWERYGWSVFDSDVERRIARGSRVDLFGDAAERRRHLERSLDRALRLDALLRRDVPGFGPVRIYSIQNAYQPTPERVALVERRGRWHVVWPRSASLDRPDRSAGLVPGDGFATLESQSWLSPQEEASLAAPPLYVPAPHRAILFTGEAKRRILEILLAP
ncbi:MAG TPA: hypothetical protein VNB06_10515 [Thermoanaerobaculia bacterium]|nr:hypothetical protein [Thermoanaerobaculia bacterium]